MKKAMMIMLATLFVVGLASPAEALLDATVEIFTTDRGGGGQTKRFNDAGTGLGSYGVSSSYSVTFGNGKVYRTASGGKIQVFNGPFDGGATATPVDFATGLGGANGVTTNPIDGNVYAVVDHSKVVQIDGETGAVLNANFATSAISNASELAWTPDGQYLFVTMEDKIRRYNATGDRVDGPEGAFVGAIGGGMKGIRQITTDSTGNYLYVGDNRGGDPRSGSDHLHKFDITGAEAVEVGSFPTDILAGMRTTGLARVPGSNVLYAAIREPNHQIIRLDPSGSGFTETVLVGSGLNIDGIAVTPEPGTLALLTLGGLMALRRRR